MSLDLQSSFDASDNCVLEKIHGSVFMSQVVRRKFGNTNLRKKTSHPLLLSSFCGNNTGVFVAKDHWQLEHIKKRT